MSDKYSCSMAITYNEQADQYAKQMDTSGQEWNDNPDKVDLWRLNKLMADVTESHSNMIHARIATKNGKPDLIGSSAAEFSDEIKAICNNMANITDEWYKLKTRLSDIVAYLDECKYQKDRNERDKEREIIKMKKAARLI